MWINKICQKSNFLFSKPFIKIYNTIKLDFKTCQISKKYSEFLPQLGNKVHKIYINHVCTTNIDNRSVQQTIHFLDIQGNIKWLLNLCCIYNSKCLKNIFLNILITKAYINAKVTETALLLLGLSFETIYTGNNYMHHFRNLKRIFLNP